MPPDILAAWAENRRLHTRAQAARATARTRAALDTYLNDLAVRGLPLPTIQYPHRVVAAGTYIAGVTGAPPAQVNHLKNQFYDKVRARGGTPDSEQRLRRQVRRLKELRAADVEEIAQLKADVEALVGALHQATAENQLLRRQLAESSSTVRTLPPQPRRV